MATSSTADRQTLQKNQTLQKKRRKPMSRMTYRPLAALALATTILAPFALSASLQAQGTSAPTLQTLIDEREVTRIPAEIEIAVDRKDWPAARAHFADQVRVDFTSLTGGTPAIVPADALIGGWSANLKGSKESLHIRGREQVSITGDTALVRSNGYAWNRMPGGPDGDLWEVWGHYTHTLTRTASGWKVTGFTFEMTHERGSMWVKATPGS
jgi:ketosteroid isomerase-like protein